MFFLLKSSTIWKVNCFKLSHSCKWYYIMNIGSLKQINRLVCLRLVSCVPNGVHFPGLSILDCPFRFFKHLFTRLKWFSVWKIYQCYLEFSFQKSTYNSVTFFSGYPWSDFCTLLTMKHRTAPPTPTSDYKMVQLEHSTKLCHTRHTSTLFPGEEC